MKYSKDDFFVGMKFQTNASSTEGSIYIVRELTNNDTIYLSSEKSDSYFDYSLNSILEELNKGTWKMLNPKIQTYEIF
jgi:hypothetical protein